MGERGVSPGALVSASDRRLADRVPFRAPVQVIGPRGPIEAEIRDLSSTGIRFRLPRDVFDEMPGDVVSAMQPLEALIGAAPVVKLHHHRLGPLVRRRVHVTRIVLPSNATAVDVGCRFKDPLTFDETVMLGVALPAERDATTAALPRADVCQTGTRESSTDLREAAQAYPLPDVPDASARTAEEEAAARAPATSNDYATAAQAAVTEGIQQRRYRPARLRTYVAGNGESIRCESDAIAPDAILVRLDRRSLRRERGGPDDGQVVGDIALGLAERFGDLVRLRVAEDGKHLWSGAARVSGIDLPDDRPDLVTVEFAFEKAMTPPERARVGL